MWYAMEVLHMLVCSSGTQVDSAYKLCSENASLNEATNAVALASVHSACWIQL